MDGQHSACGHCGQRATKRCGGCKNMQYCTLECQQADWQYHKLLCKTFADFAERPGTDIRRAIFFPPDGDKPYFIWLPVELKDEVGKGKLRGFVTEDGHLLPIAGDWSVPETDNEAQYLLPTKDNPLSEFETAITLVCGKLRSGELLDHSVLAMVRNDGHKSPPPNQCLARLATRDVHPLLSRGPLIIFGMHKVQLPKHTVDLDTTALTLALDAIIGLAPVGKVPMHAQKIMAVKVHHKKPPLLEEMEIPKRHPAFKSGTKSKAAELLGTPLQIWSYPISKENSTDSPPPSSAMKTATFDPKFFRLCIDPASPDFGRIPASIRADTRDMLVVRPSNKLDLGLDIQHFTRLGKGFQGPLTSMLSEAQGGTPEERLRRLEAFTAEGWAKTNAMMKALGLTDKDVKFPAS